MKIVDIRERTFPIVESGHVTPPELPGIGFEGKPDLYKVMKELAE